MASTRSARPRRATRNRHRPRYDDDSGSEADHRPSTERRPVRSTRRTLTYREDAGESSPDESPNIDSSEDCETQSDVAKVSAPVRTRSPVQPAVGKRKRSGLVGRSHFDSFKQRKVNSATPSQPKPLTTTFTPLGPSGRIPPWQTLEYQILVRIFKYAAYPLYSSASRPNATLEWLTSLSTLCSSFHDAAITALLHSPPLYPSYRAHRLLDLLRRDQSTLSINYQTKIIRLEVEVKQLLIRKSGIDLEELLSHTPLLTDLKLYHNHDSYASLIWAQPSQAKGKQWAYPTTLFDHLDKSNIVLKYFEWNGRFPKPVEVINIMAEMHARPCLAQLRSISLMNLDLPEKYSEQEKHGARDVLANGLSKLTQLKHIFFRNCDVLNDRVLNGFPTDLESLSLINCSSITSDELSQYLATSGSSLANMRLHGNQALDLGFMPALKQRASKLEYLSIDLTYTDPTSYNDTGKLFPYFTSLL